MGVWVGSGGLKVTHLSTPTPSVTKAAVKLSREDPGGKREKEKSLDFLFPEIKLVPFGSTLRRRYTSLFITSIRHPFIVLHRAENAAHPLRFHPLTGPICPSQRPSTLFCHLWMAK